MSSILVNGSPTKEFAMERSIRQGDPLSPFLFLIVAESLNVAMQEAVRGGLFDGVKVGLDDIEMASGLKVNINKISLFGIGVKMEEVEGWATSLRCQHGSLPFYYLGLPVGYNMGRIENWNTLVQKFKNKLSIWKARLIQYGGRLTLIKLVLGGNGESKSMAWIKWEKVISSYGMGGLNIGSLKAMSWGLLEKWWWRFRLERDAFWVKVIRSLYGEGVERRGKIGVGRLRDLFPRLYHLDVVNDAVLAKKGYWRFFPKRDTKDKCKWRLNDGGRFTVKGLRDVVDSKILEPLGSIFETSWCKLIPKKCASLFGVYIIGESQLECCAFVVRSQVNRWIIALFYARKLSRSGIGCLSGRE
ncbi:hypothetical protein Tco_0011544 [Tanacetum coccineum]